MSRNDKHKDKHHAQEQVEKPAGTSSEDILAGDAAASSQEPGAQPSVTEPETKVLQAIQAERDDLLARLQRVSADYLNYQKRVQKDIAHAREFANEEILKALVCVLDDMERALAAAQNAPADTEALQKGMQLVHEKMLSTLERFGLKPITVQPGQAFDPAIHQALMQEETDAYPPHTVVRELQKGYELKGRAIRPVSVVVAKAVEPQDGRE